MARLRGRAEGEGRPRPPAEWLERVCQSDAPQLCPAPELLSWALGAIVADEGGPIHNPDHAHLADADLAFLWASSGFSKGGRQILGQAEQVMFRAGGWQKARQEQQMVEWFGRVPAFLITLAADYCASCSDAEFCALVEHELYHIGQALDPYGAPAFDKLGRPKLRIVGHDVEEFIGVVARYGPSEDVRRLVAAAGNTPVVPRLSIARACGCCLKAA
ncbi:putative metallopeptidase [Achromobacter seleniivolatilans]|uniref:Metallopeptidase n=1 Tax=Achromobacter seleniivolatilans TaxID=3047478 RepID=A0ABY9M8L5_9BURK|nr:putative metallopeptidase [Achromobacter sp. R39]WMD23315.1 putative metallopeptidase [Achromobacter sp. R39]